MTLYPNPTQGRTTIELGELVKGAIEVEIVDFTGKVVFANRYKNQQLIDLELDFLPAACYWVNINTAEGRKVMRFLKQ